MKKSAIAIILGMCLFILCTACGTQQEWEPAVIESEPYTIVYSDKCGYTKEIGQNLAENIKEATGVSLEVVSDATTPIAEWEILVGVTSRPESVSAAEGLLDRDYRVKLDGKKLVIAATAEDSLVRAVAHLIERLTPTGFSLENGYIHEYICPQRTYNMLQLDGKYKTMGRSQLYGTSISADWSACGIEFNAYCKNDVQIQVTISAMSDPAIVYDENATYFTVYVDGQRMKERLLAKEGTTTLTIASGLEEGEHSFRFFKQAHNLHCNVDIDAITVEGEVLEKPADRDLYLEFIGDSITAGYGTYYASGSLAMTYPYSDGTQSYAFMTAENLNADYSLIARCSWGIMAKSTNNNLPAVYKYVCYSRNCTDLYDFARKPDAVIVNLGTNDLSHGFGRMAKMTDETVKFFEDIREKNGDVPIVVVYNMMNGTCSTRLTDAVEKMGGEENRVYLLKLSRGTSGGGAHPSAAEQKRAANELTEFLRENVLTDKK